MRAGAAASATSHPASAEPLSAAPFGCLASPDRSGVTLDFSVYKPGLRGSMLLVGTRLRGSRLTATRESNGRRCEQSGASAHWDGEGRAYSGSPAPQRGQRSAWRVARRRGWLVRRMLVLADVVGLVLAFVTVELLFVPAVQHASAIRMKDLLLSIISLPLWIVIAKLYRLYDQDEERTHHSNSDDIVGRLPGVVTIGYLADVRRAQRLRAGRPEPREGDRPPDFAILFIGALPHDRAHHLPSERARPPEHADRRRRRHRTARRAQATAPPRVRLQSRRLCRLQAERAPFRPRASSAAGRRTARGARRAHTTSSA